MKEKVIKRMNKEVRKCLNCGKRIVDWEKKELALDGCRYYCSIECCREHWARTGGDPKDAPKCPCF
jgi:DNA polymerase III epsilon subunit-like protein